MEEKNKGFSLRQKKSIQRPQISAPRQLSSLSASASPQTRQGSDDSTRKNEIPKGPIRERPKLGGGTSDLVKRRYSTRFTHLPDFSNADAPPMPVFPPKVRSQPSSDVTSTLIRKIEVDISALRDKNLQVEKYSTQLAADASDQELRDLQANLRKIKNRTSTDLQHNVYQNRTQFIKISKEAEKLKGEMRTLRGLISELTTSLSQASGSSSSTEPRISYESDAIKMRKHSNRSSVANLEAMWNVQLHALWKNVEGSQKHLPATPGRHVIHESGSWLELDAATWKSRRPAHIFLLNDHLLIATKKKKRLDPSGQINHVHPQNPETKLIADKCWPLQDIDLVDFQPMASINESEIRNAVSVRHGRETFTYRCDKSSSAEKTNLLLSFRRAVDELRRNLWADGGETGTKTKETFGHMASKDSALSIKTNLNESASPKDRPDILIGVDGKRQTLQWVEGQIDELDSAVALQRFEEGVRHVEQLRRLARGLKGNVAAQELILGKVNERANKLADLIMHRLVNTHSHLKATNTNIAWLSRLGLDDRAKEAFLKSRSDVLARRNRQILFEGDIHHHIFQISYVYFTLIRNTVKIYRQCFPPVMMSACVKWAKEQLDGFNKILASQLSNVRRDCTAWRDCIERAKEHAKIVDEVGLDFKHLVGINLLEEITESSISSSADQNNI